MKLLVEVVDFGHASSGDLTSESTNTTVDVVFDEFDAVFKSLRPVVVVGVVVEGAAVFVSGLWFQQYLSAPFNIAPKRLIS